ncbi:hypothetical protein LOK49_LG03G00523, partial [Camellia lanceoleosa]
MLVISPTVSVKDQPKLKYRRSDSGIWDTALDHRVLRCLLRVGFYGVYRIGPIRLDHHLVTTLAERWRIETRTFHFPVGESIVTLQDVAILFGLPVDEHTITRKDPGNKLDDLIALCVELLGAAPTQEDFIGSSLKLKWISEHFRHLPHDASDETVHHYARAYIMWLIGGVLVPNKSQNIVKMFLPLLRDFDRIPEYSWGGATLACLYRMLCRATKADTNEIAGPLVLLQVWAWERLSRIAPSRKSNIATGERAIGEGHQLLPPGPRACRWRVPFSHEVISSNVSVIFRDQFDRMMEGEFIWEPYGTEDDIMTSFPSYCTVGRDIWMAQVPLICFDIIEWHLPDRVLRQFGQVQSVPDRFDAHLAMHFRDRRGKMAIDWAKEYQTFIGEWNNRRNTIVHAERRNEVLTSLDPYMLWFRRHTCLVLSNPSDIAAFGYQGVGGSLEGLVRRVVRAYHMADAAHITRDGREGLDAIAEIRELLYDGLQQAHRRDRLDFGHFGEDPYMGVDITVTSISHPNMPSIEPSTSCLHRILPH